MPQLLSRPAGATSAQRPTPPAADTQQPASQIRSSPPDLSDRPPTPLPVETLSPTAAAIRFAASATWSSRVLPASTNNFAADAARCAPSPVARIPHPLPPSASNPCCKAPADSTLDLFLPACQMPARVCLPDESPLHSASTPRRNNRGSETATFFPRR